MGSIPTVQPLSRPMPMMTQSFPYSNVELEDDVVSPDKGKGKAVPDDTVKKWSTWKPDMELGHS